LIGRRGREGQEASCFAFLGLTLGFTFSLDGSVEICYRRYFKRPSLVEGNKGGLIYSLDVRENQREERDVSVNSSFLPFSSFPSAQLLSTIFVPI